MNKLELQKKAVEVRKGIVTGVYNAKSGHPGGSLSAADLFTYLYFEEMKVDPKNPEDENRDRFVLSKGHTAPGYYAALALKGFFPIEDLKTLRHVGSYLQGHPDKKHTPGVDMSSGSLGQGLSVAVGMALAAKMQGKDYRTYCLCGDGEIQEGQIWEAAMFAGHRKLDSGFYRFHKDFVTYTADSLQGTQGVNLVCRILPYRENSSAPPMPHPRYRVRSIHYRSSDGYDLPLRRSVLAENTVVKAGEWFSASDLQRTYNNFARLGAVRYTNITFREDTLHNLDTDIRLSMRKPNTIAFQPEGTNTAGDFGAAATLTYQNRNLFRGSELLSIELRGAFEAIKGLEGYERGDYEEYGVEARFQMPRLMTPFLSRKGSDHDCRTL